MSRLSRYCLRCSWLLWRGKGRERVCVAVESRRERDRCGGIRCKDYKCIEDGLSDSELLDRLWWHREKTGNKVCVKLLEELMRDRVKGKWDGWYGVYLAEVHKELRGIPHGEKTERREGGTKAKLKDNRPVYKWGEEGIYRKGEW